MNRLAWIAWVTLGLATVLAGGFASNTYDDAWITYRHADNLIRGLGFGFNPGVAVLGTSAPGYGLVLAALSWPLHGSPDAVPWIGSLLFLAALTALLALARHIDRSRAGAATAVGWSALFAALLLSCRWVLELAGGEAAIVTALLAGAIWFAYDGRSGWIVGGLLGVAAAMRPDAALAGVAVLPALVSGDRRFAVRCVVGSAVPPSALAVGLWLEFGSALPNTLAAKQSEFRFAATGYSAAQAEWFLRDFGPAGTSVLGLLALVGGLTAWRGGNARARRFLVALAGWLLVHELFYRAVRIPFSPWYHVAEIVVLLGLAAVGAGATGSAIVSWLSGRRFDFRVGLAAGLLLLLPVVRPGLEFLATNWKAPSDPRVRIYRDIARVLADLAPIAGSVAAVEIGVLGFHSHRPVVDLVGLVDPALLRAKIEHNLANEVLARSPRFLVDHPGFRDPYLRPLFEESRIASRLRSVGVFYRAEYPSPVRLYRFEPPSTP